MTTKNPVDAFIERLGSLAPTGTARVASRPEPEVQAVIALAAVLLDEAVAATREHPSERDAIAHAERARALYLRLCALGAREGLGR